MSTQTEIYDVVTQHIMFQMKVHYHFLKMLSTHSVIPLILNYFKRF